MQVLTHIIDPKNIEDLITSITENVALLPTDAQKVLTKEISTLNDKLATLQIRPYTRKRRGLFNSVGTIEKWFKGTMDDVDRQTINNHLTSIDTNNHNIISAINQQIQINNNFSTSISTLKKEIESDRKVFSDIITKNMGQYFVNIMVFDIKFQIQEVDKILCDLQDNIILSTLNIIHPSILTHHEIQIYKINADKLKYLKTGFAKTTTDKLIFLLKIPFETTVVNKKSIYPLQNTDTCQMINAPVTQTIEYKNQYYEYNNNKALNHLNKLEHCIFQKNCEFRKNCNSYIHILDDSTIIIHLAETLLLTSNCDERIFTLNGNYLVEFYNCTIDINNITYFNQINEIKHKYTIPIIKIAQNNNTINQLTQIDIPTIQNIEPITEVFYNNPLVYSSSYILFAIFIIVVLIFCIKKFFFMN